MFLGSVFALQRCQRGKADTGGERRRRLEARIKVNAALLSGRDAATLRLVVCYLPSQRLFECCVSAWLDGYLV